MKFKLDSTKISKSTHLNVNVDLRTRERIDEMTRGTGMTIQTVVYQMILHCLDEVEEE